MRLQKYLAGCGVCSRRKAEELISAGCVSVNGEKITSMGFIVDTNIDIVSVNDKNVRMENHKTYLLLNKPRGYITSAKDQFGRKTVMDLIEGNARLFPVGRLDYDTEGLLLITNDGDFAFRLTHPKYEIKKTYIAETEGTLSPEGLKNLREGIYIDGRKTALAEVEVIESRGNSATISITISEGRNRQVRKMCEAAGLRIITLRRVSFGCLTLESVPLGSYRRLTIEEVNELLARQRQHK